MDLDPIPFTPDLVEIDPYDSKIYEFDSVNWSPHGGFVSYETDVYDGIRLQDLGNLAEVADDADAEEYLGIGAYAQTELDIDERLLGPREAGKGWFEEEHVRSAVNHPGQKGSFDFLFLIGCIVKTQLNRGQLRKLRF